MSVPYEGDSTTTVVPGLKGTNTANGDGTWGFATGKGRGVVGISADATGVEGNSTNGAGVWGSSTNGEGVHGETRGKGAAVVGICPSGFRSNDAVLGICEGGNAIHGKSGTCAGLFEGPVVIQGASLQVNQVGNIGGEVHATSIFAANKHFRIDHPCAPADKYLQHCSVESAEMMNVYSGNVLTDQHGDATVALPAYFEALNGDFRYQLTVIGQFAQAIVAAEITNNHFAIKTDKPHVKISWQVTGIRQDAYARAYPLEVEREKPSGEKGFFLHPEVHGQPEDKGMARVPHSRTALSEAA